MDLCVGEMGFIFCGKHPILMTTIHVSDPGPMGLLVFRSKKLLPSIRPRVVLRFRLHVVALMRENVCATLSIYLYIFYTDHINTDH